MASKLHRMLQLGSEFSGNCNKLLPSLKYFKQSQLISTDVDLLKIILRCVMKMSRLKM